MLLTIAGMSSLTDGSGIHVLTFQSDDERHGWLNEVFAIGEGTIDVERGVLAMRYYRCTVDHLPDVPTGDAPG